MTGPAIGAMLVLEDGTTFRGTGYGADGETFGEMVFNTGMTGYQETLTDPSYCGQIVAMTAPHIGNTGVNDTDPESRRIAARCGPRSAPLRRTRSGCSNGCSRARTWLAPTWPVRCPLPIRTR